MNVDFKISGIERISGKMTRHPERLAKEALTQLRTQARSLCRDLAFETAPVGFGERARRGIAKSIERDLRRMFPANQLGPANGGRIYELVEHVFDKETADAFWYHYKAGDYNRAGRIMRRRGIPRTVDEAAYERARRDGKLNGPPIALAAPSRVNALLKRKLKRIGMAKAGWYQAARGVGGRLRVTTGTGATKAAFPKWVIAAGSGLSLGGAGVRGGDRPRVVIYSKVRHGRRALGDAVMGRAIKRTERRMGKIMEKAIEAKNRKTFGRGR
jgi:hypothetical protein